MLRFFVTEKVRLNAVLSGAVRIITVVYVEVQRLAVSFGCSSFFGGAIKIVK